MSLHDIAKAKVTKKQTKINITQMRKFYLFLLAMLLTAGAASAYTAADLVGKQCNVLIQGTEFGQLYNYVQSYNSEVAAGAKSDEIVLKNFLNQHFDLPLTVKNNALIFNCNQAFTATDGSGAKSLMCRRVFEVEAYMDESNSPYYDNALTGYFIDLETPLTSSAISERGQVLLAQFNNEAYVSDRSYVFDPYIHEQGYAIVKNKNGKYSYKNFGPITLMFNDYADIATEISADGSTKTYPAEIKLYDSLNDLGCYFFTLENLFNKGIYYENSAKDAITKSLMGELYPDGTFVINNTGYVEYDEAADDYIFQVYDNMIVGGDNNAAIYECDATTNGITHRICNAYFNPEIYTCQIWEISNYDNAYLYHDQFVADKNGSLVQGTWEVAPNCNHFHNEGNIRWSKKHGGDLETWEDIIVHIGSCGIISGLTDEFTDYAAGFDIPTQMPMTHDADMTIHNSYLRLDGTNRVKVEATINNRVNCHHVESYDLYVVPGKHSTINHPEFALCPEKGHEKAVLVKAGIVPTGRADDSDIHIDFDDAIEGIQDWEPESLVDHTFFLKTNYTDPELHPTFHALSTFAIQTGVENLEEETVAPVEFYNMQGVRVQNPSNGIFIRRQGDKVSKVRL